MSENGDLVVKVNTPVIQTSPSRVLWPTRCDVVHGLTTASLLQQGERESTQQWGLSRGSRSRDDASLEYPLTSLPEPVSHHQAVILNHQSSAFHMDDEDSEKPTFVHMNRTMIRCLFVLLPVGLPIMVYLKDVEFTRRVFMASLILVIVILVSCTLMTFIRKCRGQLRGAPSNTDIAQRHIMAVTHRLMPRGTAMSHGRLHRVHVESCPGEGRCLTGHHHDHLTVHYHLAPGRSRSPSPNRLGASSPYYVQRSPIPSPLRSPLRASSPYDYPLESCEIVVRAVKDDPPPYEEALMCPLAPTHHNSKDDDDDDEEDDEVEQPPPAYDGTMK